MSLPVYAEYKDSGLPWAGLMPKHWAVTRTKNVCRFTTGWTPPTGDAASYDGDNLWANISDLGARRIADTSKRVSDAAVAKAGLEVSPIGSLLFSFKLSVGQVSFVGHPMYTNEAIASFRESDQLSLAFAYYAFPLFLLTNAAHNIYGARLLNQELIRSARFPLPPKNEQDDVAMFLDRETAKIDALIAEQETLLALLAEKRQATISHAVTRGLDPDAPMKDSGIAWLGEVPAHWKVVKCGRFLSVLSGFAFPSVGFDHSGSGTRLLRGANVGVGALRWDDVAYWERTPGDGLDEYELKVGDLVLGMDRPLISAGMRVARVLESDLPCLLLQRVASLRTSAGLLAPFLMHYLSTPMFVAHFSPETTGVSVPHISPDQITSFVIAIPPVTEQTCIVEHLRHELERMDFLHENARRAIDLLTERRSALIAAAVTGKIDVRGLAA